LLNASSIVLPKARRSAAITRTALVAAVGTAVAAILPVVDATLTRLLACTRVRRT